FLWHQSSPLNASISGACRRPFSWTKTLLYIAHRFRHAGSVTNMMERDMKKKRGRPKTNGVRPGWVLLRDNIALNAYDEARTSGEKHETALKTMVAAVQRWNPEMSMSETEAKRILARWRGKERTGTILGRGEQVLQGEAAAYYLERIYDLQVAAAELK